MSSPRRSPAGTTSTAATGRRPAGCSASFARAATGGPWPRACSAAPAPGATGLPCESPRSGPSSPRIPPRRPARRCSRGGHAYPPGSSGRGHRGGRRGGDRRERARPAGAVHRPGLGARSAREGPGRHRGARRMLTIADPETVAYFLGNGREVAAHDTVPFTIWAAARHLADFEEAIGSQRRLAVTSTPPAPSSAASPPGPAASRMPGCERRSRSPSGATKVYRAKSRDMQCRRSRRCGLRC